MAIDLPAIFPYLADQLHLMLVFLCTQAERVLEPGVKRMRGDSSTLRGLPNRIPTLGELTHRVKLALLAEVSFAHHGLLASNLGKKASTNLGAIQNDRVKPSRHCIFCSRDNVDFRQEIHLPRSQIS